MRTAALLIAVIGTATRTEPRSRPLPRNDRHSKTGEKPCKSTDLRNSFTRLKIAVSPVRVGVSQLRAGAQEAAPARSAYRRHYGPARWTRPGSSWASTPASHSATAISASRSMPVSSPRCRAGRRGPRWRCCRSRAARTGSRRGRRRDASKTSRRARARRSRSRSRCCACCAGAARPACPAPQRARHQPRTWRGTPTPIVSARITSSAPAAAIRRACSMTSRDRRGPRTGSRTRRRSSRSTFRSA